VEMKWVESIIPVEYCKLNIRAVGVWNRIGLMAVYSGIEGIVTHSQGGEERWGWWFAERPANQRYPGIISVLKQMLTRC
jgi:hypothetical protein